MIPAKFGFDKEEWPGEEPGPNQVFTFMAQAFEWEPTQLEWFLQSKDILWAFSKGGSAEGEGKLYHNHITRNTKVAGMLPLRLFHALANLGTHRTSGKNLLGKALYTMEEARETSYTGNAPKGYDYSKKALLVEITSRGTAENILIPFHNDNSWNVFFDKLNPPSIAQRRSRIEEWRA